MTTRRNTVDSARLSRNAAETRAPMMAIASMTSTASSTIRPNSRPVATADTSRRNAKQGSSA
jgi:hypothetical protein